MSKDLRRYSGYVVSPRSSKDEDLFADYEAFDVKALFNKLSIGDAIVINRIDDADPNEI